MTIKEIRRHTNLSQAEFAEKYNLPLAAVERWESGKATPPKSTVNFIKFQAAADYPQLKYFISEEDKYM